VSGWGDPLNTFGLSYDCRDWLFVPGLGYGAFPDIVMEALWNACRADHPHDTQLPARAIFNKSAPVTYTILSRYLSYKTIRTA